ncbi:MAG: hypothetical protein HFI13_11130 [Lachnospiraceae bacterium]|nr:hypothetical protein [Lachnospiraceae bacterium]
MTGQVFRTAGQGNFVKRIFSYVGECAIIIQNILSASAWIKGAQKQTDLGFRILKSTRLQKGKEIT